MKSWIKCAAALLCIGFLAGCDRGSPAVPAELKGDGEMVV